MKTLLNSEFQSALSWMARHTDKKTGKKISKVEEAEAVIKYEKDTFSMYGRTRDGHKFQINDIRNDAIFLRRLPDGKIDIADHYLFCLGGGNYLLTDWNCVWKAMSQLYKDHGTVIYQDCWRLNKDKFITLLKIATSGKMK